jgi:hypothetical protein
MIHRSGILLLSCLIFCLQLIYIIILSLTRESPKCKSVSKEAEGLFVGHL